MSRIGKKIIVIPQNIKIDISNHIIKVSGPKGELFFNISESINIKRIENFLQLSKKYNDKKTQGLYGLNRSIINNMVIGVSKGFEKKLIINGVGYRAQMDNKILILNLGYSHQIQLKPPKDITIKVENNTNIFINGIDKEKVGQIAAQIRNMRPPEPYKGKGIRYVNEIIKRKVGKAGK
uniref:Large ribosomal subunit protein uL6c n=1 Tax=Taenioma perpusillum TaxID=210852 RepID=A0A1Z1MS10_9FLOR|nr:ribosomal protein L6 [Taenioma perpusillum]ARW68555.1 ribosomal protein L6 [Taenioma perpusillum]